MIKLTIDQLVYFQTFSKIHEKIIYNQLYEYFNDKHFSSQCGFREGYSYQNRLLVMTEKFKESIDKANTFGALLIDLSKTFDCIDHRLLNARLLMEFYLYH